MSARRKGAGPGEEGPYKEGDAIKIAGGVVGEEFVLGPLMVPVANAAYAAGQSATRREARAEAFREAEREMRKACDACGGTTIDLRCSTDEAAVECEYCGRPAQAIRAYAAIERSAEPKGGSRE